MEFEAIVSTADGRLTKGRIYYGTLVAVGTHGSLRIVVYDNLKVWMTFDPNVFIPVKHKPTTCLCVDNR